MIKHYVSLLAICLLVLSAAPVLADEHEAQATTQAQASTSITPASPFYGLTTAWERVQLAFTRDAEKRADKAMSFADKKLTEVEVLAQQGDFERSERSLARYEQLMEQASEAVERLETARDGQEASASLEATTRVRANMQARLDNVIDVHERILERQAETMSDEQLERVEHAFNRINDATLRADNRFEESRERAKVRSKVLANLSDEQANELEANISAQIGLQAALEARSEKILARMDERNQRLLNETSNRSERAREQLSVVLERQANRLAENFERRNQQVMQRADNRSQELAENLRVQAQVRAEAAAEARERAQQERASQREERTQQRERVSSEQSDREQTQQERVDISILVNTASEQSTVELSVDGEESRFVVNSSSRERVISEISTRTGLSSERISSVAEWSSSDEDSRVEAESETRVGIGAGNTRVDSESRVSIRG